MCAWGCYDSRSQWRYRKHDPALPERWFFSRTLLFYLHTVHWMMFDVTSLLWVPLCECTSEPSFHSGGGDEYLEWHTEARLPLAHTNTCSLLVVLMGLVVAFKCCLLSAFWVHWALMRRFWWVGDWWSHFFRFCYSHHFRNFFRQSGRRRGILRPISISGSASVLHPFLSCFAGIF